MPSLQILQYFQHRFTQDTEIITSHLFIKNIISMLSSYQIKKNLIFYF